MKKYIAFCKRFNKYAMMAAMLFLLATAVITFVQVVTRTAMHFSFRWAEELTRYIMIFAVFLASGTLLASDEHPRVEILSALLPEKVQLRLNYLYYALIFLFLCFLAIYGWQLTVTSINKLCSSIRIPWAIPFSSVLVGAVNMLIQIPAKFMKNHLDIRALNDGEGEQRV